MKIKITKSGMGSKVINPDGSELTNVTSIAVRAEVQHPTKADITLSCIGAEISVDRENVSFSVGGHKEIVALINKDGDVISLTTDGNE